MSNYYCLIAGLPDIHLDDHKLPYTVSSFRDEVYEQLSGKDQKTIDLFFLRYDNQNLLAYLKDKDAKLDERGSLTADDFEVMVKQAKEGDKLVGVAPYFETFLTRYFEEKTAEENLLVEDLLSALYFDYALKSSNDFAAKWFEFSLNLNNMLIASSARKHGFSPEPFIIGGGDVAKALKTSSARDWGLGGELEYVETVQRIAEETEIQEKERKIDQLKWDWLEENTFFHYFSVERIISFLLRLEVIERWQKLDKDAGEANLRAVIARLKEEVALPEDYE